MTYQKEKLGVALVGLGKYASEELMPALQETAHCYLAGIVTGSPEKAKRWKEKYQIREENIYNYENYDSIRDNTEIDIIYVVLPNSMHAEYTIRGAKAGKHMICEKPMAISVEECKQMIDACKSAGKFLSIGYRLHFDPYHLEMMRLGNDKVFGEIKKITSSFSIKPPKGAWRLNKKYAGGGPLMDVGIYCIQGVCYITGMKPIAVTAEAPPVSDPEKFINIEETLNWKMEMPGGLIAECKTSYSEETDDIKVEAKNGFFELEPAFDYEGLKGRTSDGKLKFPKINQQARQLDGIALAYKNNQPSIIPGEMGLRDIKIIEAIYKSTSLSERVEI